MTSVPGTKKKTAAITHKLIDDVPLWPAAAIHRGPSTVAMLNSSTSQKPIVFRSCDFGSEAAAGGVLPGARPLRESAHPAPGNRAKTGLSNPQKPSRNRILLLSRLAETPPCPPSASPSAYRGS